MRILLVLLDKEFRQFFRSSFLPKMVVIFPMMIMFVIPWVTTMDVRHIGVSVVDNDRTAASRRSTLRITSRCTTWRSIMTLRLRHSKRAMWM